MSLIRVKNVVTQTLIEWPAKRQSFEKMAEKLEKSGQQLEERLEKAQGTPEQKKVLRHIIGIERWGQRRLWLAIQFSGERGVRSSEAAFSDAHHLYKPAESTSWQELTAKFEATRLETIKLAHHLAEADIDETMRVPHNDLGPLSLRGWLRYLQTHAALEGRRIR